MILLEPHMYGRNKWALKNKQLVALDMKKIQLDIKFGKSKYFICLACPTKL